MCQCLAFWWSTHRKINTTLCSLMENHCLFMWRNTGFKYPVNTDQLGFSQHQETDLKQPDAVLLTPSQSWFYLPSPSFPLLFHQLDQMKHNINHKYLEVKVNISPTYIPSLMSSGDLTKTEFKFCCWHLLKLEWHRHRVCRHIFERITDLLFSLNSLYFNPKHM